MFQTLWPIPGTHLLVTTEPIAAVPTPSPEGGPDRLAAATLADVTASRPRPRRTNGSGAVGATTGGGVDYAAVAALVRSSRAEQGLPPAVTDPDVLRRVAEVLFDGRVIRRQVTPSLGMPRLAS